MVLFHYLAAGYKRFFSVNSVTFMTFLGTFHSQLALSFDPLNGESYRSTNKSNSSMKNFLVRDNFSFLYFSVRTLVNVIIIGLLFTLFLLPQSAMAETTAISYQPIQGRAPGLTSDNGDTILNNVQPQTVPDLYQILSEDNTVLAKPPETELVVKDGTPFAEILALVTADNNEHNLTRLSDLNVQYFDSDGDAADTISPIQGTLKAYWTDGNKNIIDVSELTHEEMSVCNQDFPPPYTLTIESSDVRLRSEYGLPNTSNLGGGTHSYNVNITDTPEICLQFKYVQPSLTPSFADYNPKVWSPKHGFRVQSKTDPTKNFPTTGFDGATFELVTNQDIPSGTIWYVNYDDKGNDTLQVFATQTSKRRVLVTLTGSNGIHTGEKSAFVPHTVTIENQNKTARYQFRVERWFILTKELFTFAQVQRRCIEYSGSGDGFTEGKYRVPSRADFTNNPYADARLYPPRKAPTAPTGGNFIRAIGTDLYSGGGFFSEWGDSIPHAYDEITDYWTRERTSDGLVYFVNVNDGSLSADSVTDTKTELLTRSISACRSF